MTILQIEHTISSFEGWKEAFDSDPINRKDCGVRHYLVFRPVDDPNYVIVHLGFDTVTDAKETLGKLERLWQKVEGSILINPQTRILDIAEAVEV
jgi:hypothetical protein